MNERIFLRKDLINNKEINNEDLLFLILLLSEIGESEQKIDFIYIPAMVDYVSNDSNKEAFRKKMNKSIKKLSKLGIINSLKYEHRYKVIGSSIKFGNSKDRYILIYLSDIIRISECLNGCNLFKLVRLYVSIISNMDFSAKLPKTYKNKVYHLGMNYLMKESYLSEVTFRKYLKTLIAEKVVYLTKESGMHNGYNFISRYEDKEICKAFAKKQELRI